MYYIVTQHCVWSGPSVNTQMRYSNRTRQCIAVTHQREREKYWSSSKNVRYTENMVKRNTENRLQQLTGVCVEVHKTNIRVNMLFIMKGQMETKMARLSFCVIKGGFVVNTLETGENSELGSVWEKQNQSTNQHLKNVLTHYILCLIYTNVYSFGVWVVAAISRAAVKPLHVFLTFRFLYRWNKYNSIW